MSEDGLPLEVSTEQRASLITYPSVISVKAMGLAATPASHDAAAGGGPGDAGDAPPGFQALIESLVLPLIEPAKPSRIDVRASSGGKYCSVSVQFTVTTQGQLEAIYSALHAEPRVLFTL